MRGLFWILSLAPLIASLAILTGVDSMSRQTCTELVSQTAGPCGDHDAAKSHPVTLEAPLPIRLPALRGAMPLQGQALLPRSAPFATIDSSGLVGECGTPRSRGATSGRSVPDETLLAKRVRLQI